MNMKLRFFAIALVLTMATAGAGRSLAEESVKYRGDSWGKQICRSVVQDKPQRLKRILREVKREALYGYTLTLLGDEIAGSFTCNGQYLWAFAQTVGARDVTYFLSTGIISDGAAIVAREK